MKLEDIPDSPPGQYPERIALCISTETKGKLQKIEATKGRKAKVEFVRKALDQALKDIAV